MEPRPTLVAQLQQLAALPERSGAEVAQAALFNLMLDAAAAEQATITESLARLKAIQAVRLSKGVTKDTLASMSEMGEMEQLRLQMAMDRLAKMMSTLSNLLKKISDTAAAITQNLK